MHFLLSSHNRDRVAENLDSLLTVRHISLHVEEKVSFRRSLFKLEWITFHNGLSAKCALRLYFYHLRFYDSNTGKRRLRRYCENENDLSGLFSLDVSVQVHSISSKCSNRRRKRDKEISSLSIHNSFMFSPHFDVIWDLFQNGIYLFYEIKKQKIGTVTSIIYPSNRSLTIRVSN